MLQKNSLSFKAFPFRGFDGSEAEVDPAEVLGFRAFGGFRVQGFGAFDPEFGVSRALHPAVWCIASEILYGLR